MSTSPFDQVNFQGRDWGLMKQYLEEQLQTSMEYMCTDLSIDDVNKLRGRILFINTLLKRADLILKQAAKS